MEIMLSFWNVLAMMAPWLLVGFLLAGVVSVLLPRKWVVGVMGRARGWRGVLNAVLIGVPLPVCSCGVLPQVTADAASETLAWWEHLAAAVLVALVACGLIKRRRGHCVK